MSSSPGPVVPARWRDEYSPEEGQSRARRRRVLGLLIAVFALAGLLVWGLPYLRPPARGRLVSLNVSSYRDRTLPNLPWRTQDHASLIANGYFPSHNDNGNGRLDQAGLVRRLGGLRGLADNEAVVVYLSAYARTDASGHVQVLPADADLGDSATWLPLGRILDLLRQAGARRRLLVLDLAPPPARSLVLLDDVMACVARDAEAMPDDGRLVLCGCAAGQELWSSEVLGRSVFGWYFEDGLRGRADADGDGRVSARELGAFVRDRVDRWARLPGARQTPVLLGEARDFVLVDLPNGAPQPELRPIEDRTYPEWLQKAWPKAAGVARRQELMLAAERDWRSGLDAAAVQAEVNAALQASDPAPPPAPPARSLALAGREPPRELSDALRQAVFQAEARTRGLDAAKAADARTQTADEFIKAQKNTPSAQLAGAALDAAVADPRPGTLRFLAVLVSRLDVRPEFVETLDLQRVAALDLPLAVAQRALELVRGGEQAASQPRLFPWLGRELEAALQARYEALVLFEAAGYASEKEGESSLAICSTRTDGVLARQGVLQDVMAALDRARAVLPDALAMRERSGGEWTRWLAAARAALALSDRLDAARGRDVAEALNDLRRQMMALRAPLDEVGDPFTPDGVDRLIQAAKRGAAEPANYRNLDGLLATTQVPPAERPAVWSAAMDLSGRLEETLRLDQAGGSQVAEPPPVAEQDALLTMMTAADREVLLAGLAGLGAKQRQPLERAVGGKPDRGALAGLERQLRLLWRTLPVRESGDELWAFLAGRYRYASRDLTVLWPDSQAAAFYTRAAADYQRWLRPGRDQYAEIIEGNDPPRLLPWGPITAVLEVRTTAPPDHPARVALDVFTADSEWLDVQPQRVLLPSTSVPTTADGGSLVSLRIALRPRAGEGKAPQPRGLLARARLDADRAYHRRIDVPLSPRAPEVVISASNKTPGPPLGGVRLRVIPGKQAVYAYLRNPIDREWKKLVVRLSAAGQTRQTAPFSLGPRAVELLVFPAGAPVVPPPAAAPATPATPAAPAPPALLPELTGPLQLDVIDQDGKNEVLTSRKVVVDLGALSEYVAVTAVRYDPTGGRNRLSVNLRLRRRFPGAEVTATMGFPAPIDGGASYRDGTLQGKLPPDGTELTLFADGVSGADGRALFYISVDGWERAFLFEVTLNATGEVTPRQRFEPMVRPRVAPYALATPTFTVPVEADNAPPDSRLEVLLGRFAGGRYQVEVSDRRDSPRNRRIGFDPSGPGGALVFDASLRDWSVNLDTTLIRGPRELRVYLRDRAGRQLAYASRSLTLGDTAPSGVEFVDPPEQAWRMAPLPLRARVVDPLVGIKEVRFFVGRPVGNKLPPGMATTPGTPVNDNRTLWGVKLPLPADRKGPTDISVQFVNLLGLSSFATTSVDLLETDPALTRPATIRGRVHEGDRPQSGLKVVLTDEKNAEKGTAVTKADGTFEFAGLPPGKYRLGVTKSSNGRKGAYPRKAGEFITLAPGGTVNAEIPLLLP